MASKAQHLQKAEHNESFFGQFPVATTPFIDWVVTGIFYAALHYLRAVASKYGFTNVSSYADMDQLFAQLVPLRRRADIWTDYRHLKDDSRDARYEMRRFQTHEVLDLQSNHFSRIRKFARRELDAG